MHNQDVKPSSFCCQQVSLTIDITDVRHEILVDDPRLRGLEVQELFGESNPIEPSVVRFR